MACIVCVFMTAVKSNSNVMVVLKYLLLFVMQLFSVSVHLWHTLTDRCEPLCASMFLLLTERLELIIPSYFIHPVVGGFPEKDKKANSWQAMLSADAPCGGITSSEPLECFSRLVGLHSLD